MKIIVHRGFDQVGGSIVEISTDTTRIFIDMGENLPGSGKMSQEEEKSYVDRLFAQNKKEKEAVFYTHGHGDHVGMMQYVPKHVSQYMSKGTKRLLCIKENNLLETFEHRLESVQTQIAYKESYYTFVDKIKDFFSYIIPFKNYRRTLISLKKELVQLQKNIAYQQNICHTLNRVITWERSRLGNGSLLVKFGDISITPYLVSHAIYDAHGFLVEAEGKRIFHTGDYRGHGHLSELSFAGFRKIGQIDYLISEGSMLSEGDKRCETEAQISAQMEEVMRQYKYVFVLSSSTDYERLMSVGMAANKVGKRILYSTPLLGKMMNYFNTVNNSDIFNSDAYRLLKRNEEFVVKNKQNLDEGFVMLITTGSMAVIEEWCKYVSQNDMVMIYSVWSGYCEKILVSHSVPIYKRLRRKFNHVADIHTSGHADIKAITDTINLFNPREGIIGIHKDCGTSMADLDISDELKSKVIEDVKKDACVEIRRVNLIKRVFSRMMIKLKNF